MKSWDMVAAAPVVIAERLTLLAVAGPAPGGRAQKEVVRMVQEKFDASGESMRGAATGIVVANQRFFRMFSERGGVGPDWMQLTETMLTSSLDSVDRSVTPFHRCVTDNARRLRR